jgi:hypothetical protein
MFDVALTCVDCGGDFDGTVEAMFRDHKDNVVCPFCVAFRIMARCACYACNSDKYVSALLLTDLDGRLVPMPVCSSCIESGATLNPSPVFAEVVGGKVIPDGGTV